MCTTHWHHISFALEINNGTTYLIFCLLTNDHSENSLKLGWDKFTFIDLRHSHNGDICIYK